MQIGMARDAQETALKVQAALQSQPEWAKDFLANALPGQPLPYHTNFRVTEDQYKSLLLAATTPTLIEVGKVTLSVTRQTTGDLLLVTEPPVSRIHGITLSQGAKVVATPLAPLATVSPIDNQNAKGPTGRWTGTQWSTESNTSGRKLAVKFALGKRSDYGDNIIYYDVKDSRSDPGATYYEILLFPAAK
jgi:hypothetical protein